MSYDFGYTKIDDLSMIVEKKNIHYEYEGINFLFKHKSKDKLIVLFHGSVPQFSNIENTKRVVFRGYNYDFTNADILSFSDGLMNIYSEYMIGWFLSTKKYDFDKIYKKIMTYIIDRFGYDKILFTGTSGGGYPAIKYASLYNKYALVSNSQLYLEKYNRKFIGYNKLKEFLVKYDDDIVYDGIENIIDNHKPKKLIIYTNMYDYTYYVDLVKFIKYVEKNDLDNIVKIELFEDCESDDLMVHQIQFPDKEKYKNVLERTINYDI